MSGLALIDVSHDDNSLWFMLRLYKLSWSICFLHALFPAFAIALPSASARYSDKTVSELARMLVPTAAGLSIALMKCLDVRPSAANELGSSDLKFLA